MTSVTERLHELLDERWVEYRFNDATKVFEWHFEGTDGEGSAYATEVAGGINIIACSLTPEQAIAATLESDSEYERKMDALLCRLTNGKFSKTRTYDLDFMESVVREEFETECVSEPGTCKLTQASWDDDICTWGCICSACDAHLEHETGIGYNFCPICGAKVVVE